MTVDVFSSCPYRVDIYIVFCVTKQPEVDIVSNAIVRMVRRAHSVAFLVAVSWYRAACRTAVFAVSRYQKSTVNSPVPVPSK